MSIPYDENLSVDFGKGINDANNAYKALHGINIPYDPGMISVMSQRAAFDYYTGNRSWPDSYVTHINEYRDEYGLPHIGPGPTPPFKVAPRFWKGNMCGVRVPGLPAVPGGAVDASLVLSWFYDRYSDSDRARIRQAWHDRGYSHVLLSWPDSRSGNSDIQVAFSAVQFKVICQELIADGFFPCVMLTSKDYDPKDVDQIMAGLGPVFQQLVGVVPMFCVGWELSLWLSPTQVQQLIDRISPQVKAQAGTLLYVHFQEGYPSFQQPGGSVADFWNPNVGKLDGLLYQKLIAQNDVQFLDSLNDCLQRFGGGFNMVKGFDFVGLELSAMTQFNGQTSEAEGDRIGTVAINAPKVNGVGVSGSGNGLQ